MIDRENGPKIKVCIWSTHIWSKRGDCFFFVYTVYVMMCVCVREKTNSVAAGYCVACALLIIIFIIMIIIIK